MNLTIPLRVANPNFSNANFTSVGKYIPEFLYRITITSIWFFQRLKSHFWRHKWDKKQIQSTKSSEREQISFGIISPPCSCSRKVNQQFLRVEPPVKYLQNRSRNHNILPLDNHLTWLKDYCTREQSGPKIISLNIQMSTNVTFRNAVQQTAIKQLCYISCDPNTNALSNCQ